MKTQKILRTVRFCLPLVLVAVWGGTALTAQEKPKALLLWQNGEIYRKNMGLDSLFPGQIQNAPKLKSEKTAFALSLFGTLLPTVSGFASLYGNTGDVTPFIIFGSGLVFGPSLGYFYGGRVGRGITGIGIRAGLAAATVVAADEAGKSGGWGGAIAASIGSGVVFVAGVVDIASVPGAVRKHNRLMQEKALVVTPAYFAQHGAPGVKVQIQF